MNRRLIRNAPQHRAEPTRAEAMVWANLRNRQLGGNSTSAANWRVHRRLVCFDWRLIVELDGWTHSYDETALRDANRQTWLEAQGYTILRFADEEVHDDRSGVINSIYTVLTNL